MLSEKQRTKLNDTHKKVLDFHHQFRVLQFSSIGDQIYVIFNFIYPNREQIYYHEKKTFPLN